MPMLFYSLLHLTIAVEKEEEVEKTIVTSSRCKTQP